MTACGPALVPRKPAARDRGVRWLASVPFNRCLMYDQRQKALLYGFLEAIVWDPAVTEASVAIQSEQPGEQHAAGANGFGPIRIRIPGRSRKGVSGHFIESPASKNTGVVGAAQGLRHAFAPPYDVDPTGRRRSRRIHHHEDCWTQQRRSFATICSPVAGVPGTCFRTPGDPKR